MSPGIDFDPETLASDDEVQATEALDGPELRDPWFTTEVAFGSSIGIGVFDPRKLSKPLNDAGYPSLIRTQWTPFAVDGELWMGKHVPAFDYIRFQQARKDDPQGGVKTQLRMTLAEVSYGYALVQKGNFSLLPRLGFGIVDTEFRLQRSGETDFESTLVGFSGAADGDQPRTLLLKKSGMVTDLGLGLTYLFEFGKGPRKPGLGTGIRVGLRLGGLVQLFDFGPQKKAWKREGDAVSGAPDMRLDGFYLRLFLAPSMIHRSRREPQSAG